MEKKTMILNALLAATLGAGLLVGMIWRTFQPNVVLADLDIPAMAAIVLIALLIEYFVTGLQKRAWVLQIILAAVTFAVLPWAADLPYAGIKVTLCGTVVFAVLTWMFDSIAQRLDVTTECKGAMVPTAFVLYLACQCFMGMIL